MFFKELCSFLLFVIIFPPSSDWLICFLMLSTAKKDPWNDWWFERAKYSSPPRRFFVAFCMTHFRAWQIVDMYLLLFCHICGLGICRWCLVRVRRERKVWRRHRLGRPRRGRIADGERLTVALGRHLFAASLLLFRLSPRLGIPIRCWSYQLKE